MLFKTAWRNLARNKRRTLVLLLTVSMGVGALFLFDGFNAGIMNQYRDNTIHAKTGHGQLNTKGYREAIYEKPWEHWMEQPEGLEAKIRSMPGVKQVFPRIDFFAVITNGSLSVAGRGTAVRGRDEADFFWTLNVVEGEMLRDHQQGIMIGIGLARALQVKPGDRITLLTNTVYGSMNGMDARVTGIFHTGLKEVDDNYFRIQLDDAQRLLDTNKVETMAIGLASHQDWSRFATAVKDTLPELDATPFEVLDKVYYQHAVDWLDQQFAVIQLIILVIVTLGIFNTISFTVVERTPEIGNLRANGESAGEVLLLLLWEGFLIGLIGSALGILGAWLLNVILLPKGILMPPAPGITRQFNVMIELQWPMVWLSGALGLGSTVLATWLAAWRKVRTPIGEALRYR
jgi:putative ABC transport system permease protein